MENNAISNNVKAIVDNHGELFEKKLVGGKKDGCAPSFFFSLNTCYLPGSAATQTAFLIAASFRT